MHSLYHSGRLSQYLLWLACAAGVVGLLASRALVSLSAIPGLLAVLTNPHLRRDLPGYWRNGAAMRAAAMYGLFLLGTLYTREWAPWRHEVYRLLPWISVPLTFAVAVPLSRWQRRAVGALFALGTAAIGLATLSKYFRDPAAAIGAISVGQNMPSVTRIFHIHFGLMLGLAFFVALLLRREVRVAWLRWLLLLAAAGIAVTLHLLAYRTGLLVLYGTLLADALRLLARRRYLLPGLGLLALLALAPWVAYHTLSSVRQRVGASRWDINQFRQGHDINNYSLARRLAAWETAGRVIGRNPAIGVGPADVNAAMMAAYDQHDYGLLPENRVMIHNQYLHYLVGSGVLGLALWLAVLLWPLLKPGARRNPYIWHFLLVLGLGMLVDSVLELQIGFNLFVFGYGFLVVADERRRSKRPEPDQTPRRA